MAPSLSTTGRYLVSHKTVKAASSLPLWPVAGWLYPAVLVTTSP